MAEDVELAQAQQQIEAARSNIEQQRETAARAEQQLQQQQELLQSQRVLRAAGLQGTAQRQAATQQIKSASENIGEFKKQLSQYEKEVVSPAEKQLGEIKSQIQYQSDYESGKALQRNAQGPIDVRTMNAAQQAGFMAAGDELSASQESLMSEKVSAAIDKLNAGVSEAEAFKGLPSIKTLEQTGYIKITKTNADGTVDRNPVQVIEVSKFDTNMGNIPSTPSFSTGLGMVSASDLNTKGTITGYGVSGTTGSQLGLQSGLSSGDDNKLQSGNIFSRISSWFSSSSKKGYQEAKVGTYIPQLGALGTVSAAGEKGTLILTPAPNYVAPSSNFLKFESTIAAQPVPQRVTEGGQFVIPEIKISSTPLGAAKTFLVDIPSEFAQAGGRVAEYTATKLGINVMGTMAERKIPQRVTEGGQFIIPEQQIGYITPKGIGTVTTAAIEFGIYGAEFKAGTTAAKSLFPEFSKTLSTTLKRATSDEFNLFEKTAQVPSKPTVFYMNPKQVMITPKITGEEVTTVLGDVFGTATVTQAGRAVEVTKNTPLRTLFGFKPKVIYEGNPFQNPEGYKAAKGLLEGTGLTKAEATNILRYQAPIAKQVTFTGEAATIYGADKDVLTLVKGTTTTKGLELESGVFKTRKIKPTQDILVQGGKVVEGKGGEFYQSTPKITYTYLTPTGRPFQFLTQRGKTTGLFEQRSAVRQVGEVTLGKELAGSDFGLNVFKEYPAVKYQEGSLTKSILESGQLGRKISSSESTIFVLKNENIPTVKIEPPFTVRNTAKFIPKSSSLSVDDTKNLLKSLYEEPKPLVTVQQTSLAKTVPTLPRTIARKPIASSILDITPRQVQSPFAGLGLYERTAGAEVTSQKIFQPQTVSGITKSSLISDTTTLQAQSPFQIGGVRLSLGQTQQPAQIERQTTSQISSLGQTQAQIQRQVTTQTTAQRQRFGEPAKPSPPITPRILLPKKESGKSKLFKKLLTFGKSYNVYTRRKGKEILIGKGLPFGKATKVGAEIAMGTLAASFKLKESNIPTLEADIDYNLGKQFTPSKREAGRMVQIAKYRLGSFGERKEIKMFQKSKIKKGRFF